MKHRCGLIWSWLVPLVSDWLPDAPPCMRLRGWLYGLGMRRRGKDFQVASGARLNGLENIAVGDHVYLARGAVILADLQVELGDEVMIAWHSVVTDGNHTRCGASYRFGPRANAPVRIGAGSWIAANATITPGVELGRGVLVAANSVVTRDAPDGAMLAGVPARCVRVMEGRALDEQSASRLRMGRTASAGHRC